MTRSHGPQSIIAAAAVGIIVGIIIGSTTTNSEFQLQTSIITPTTTELSSIATAADNTQKTTTTSCITLRTVIPNNFELAFNQSFGFFDDINEETWERHRQRVRQRQNHRVPRYPRTWSDMAEIWYQHNFEPDFTCHNERRVGGMGDGPKWICDPHRLVRINNERRQQKQGGCLVYSIGSAGNFQFEDGLYEIVGRNVCEYHIFDPDEYFARPWDDKKRMFYHAWAIRGSEGADNNDPKSKTLEQSMIELGHVGRIIDIFKIDCEGCEWNTYKDWLRHDIRQIQVETHGVPDQAIDFFESLQAAGYLMFHKEFNLIAKGTCVEFSFIKVHQDFFKQDELTAMIYQDY